MKDMFRNSSNTLEYKIDGSKWTVRFVSSAFPDKPREYTYTIGEPFDSVGMDGTPFKVHVYC